MRAGVSGVLLGLGLLVVWAVGFPEVPFAAAQAQRPASPALVSQDRAGTPDLIAMSSDVGTGPQQITIVDPRARAMAVYHVDRVTGELSLKSVRNLSWDLQIEDFNSANPTPREIRAISQR